MFFNRQRKTVINGNNHHVKGEAALNISCCNIHGGKSNKAAKGYADKIKAVVVLFSEAVIIENKNEN